MSWYDTERVAATVKALGDRKIALVGDGGEVAATTVTLNELINYIHVTGGCVSRHLNVLEMRELEDRAN